MRFQLPEEPYRDGVPASPIDTVVVPRTRDLGGFEVRRALPSARRRMVGPFVFFDQMGPAVLRPGQGLDVRPHPHIGLATVTYLFEGELLHRDSLGTVQAIQPGAVNWMTAGRGIVHSERTPPETRAAGGKLFGIQLWLALPKAHEETAPAFAHTPAEQLPWAEDDGGVAVRLVLGELFGARSPVRTFSPTLYADVTLEALARLPFHGEWEERAAYVVDGVVEAGGERCEAGRLVVFRPRAEVELVALTPARLLLLGGDPMDGRRYVWWNFVSSSPERIEQAAAEWATGCFAPVPDETDFIPLPDQPRIARYP
jgi:redox-sensitive bicupin YhaK (pirin superfamily)